MPALITELINAAMDESKSTKALLDRAFITAQRLKITDLTEWLRKELDGYGEYEEGIPEYRRVRGQLMVDSPNGLLPVRIKSSATNKALTERFIGMSIPELEQITQIATEHFLCPPFDEEQRIIQKIFTPSKICGHPKVKISGLDLIRIIETVKTKVLRWALDLEAKERLGEGMTFSQEKKQIVQPHYHFGDVIDSLIQIDSNSSTQTQTTTKEGASALTTLIELLEEALQHGQIPEDHRAELQAELITLQAQANSPKPKWSIIKATASSLKGILENATGGILASQALPYVTALLR